MQASIRKLQVHRALLLALVGTAALANCGCTTSITDFVHNGFKLGPNFHEPPVPLTQQWVDAKDPRVHVADPNLATWWDVFEDPVLTGLIQRAHTRNLTVRAAAYQILAAREIHLIAIGQLLPQSQSYVLQYVRGEVSRNGGNAAAAGAAFGTSLTPPIALSPVASPSTPIAGVTDPGSGTTTSNGASASSSGATGPAGTTPGFFTNIANSLNMSWEIDFWGLLRRNLEASTAILDQSVDNYDEMMVLLLANVAQQYVEIRTLQKRLELARQNVALQEPLVQAFEKRYKTGITNAYPGYYQLKSNLDNTKALIPQLEITLRQDNNALCTLLGIPVRDLLPELGDGTVPDPADPTKRAVRIPRPRDPAVVVGIPGELLLRRPDIKAAAEQLKNQSAQIGIAEAEMYPHIAINGSIGLAAKSLPLLFNSHSWTGSIGPTLNWNILNYGRLLANVRLQDDTYQQFVATYQNAVLNANQDAENALVAYLKSLDQSEHLQDSADAAAKVTKYYVNQLKEGYLPPGTTDTSAFINQLFTTTNFQVTQQDSAAQAEGNIALNLILLYRAMGGGWEIRCQDTNFPCPDNSPDDFSLPLTYDQTLPGRAKPPIGQPDLLPAPRVIPPPPTKSDNDGVRPCTLGNPSPLPIQALD
jgi:NodT family efflux transporter outer membrane factor (OMF) lipoprotein